MTQDNITLIEFGDYQCQECAKFHKETLSQIINNYVDTGRNKISIQRFRYKRKSIWIRYPHWPPGPRIVLQDGEILAIP